MIKKAYFVALYDSFDGWTLPLKEFDNLEKARRYRDNKNNKLADENKRMGEHYGIFKSDGYLEIECHQHTF